MNATKIKYDEPFEVIEKQYYILMKQFAGGVAGRKEGGKFYIKVWSKHYLPLIDKLLNEQEL